MRAFWIALVGGSLAFAVAVYGLTGAWLEAC